MSKPTILALSLAALLQACASSPPTATPASPPAPAPPHHVSDPPADADAELEAAAKGYQRVVRDGKPMYCKRQRQTGSKLATNVCLTEMQLRQQAEQARRFETDRMQQGRRCSAGPACQNP